MFAPLNQTFYDPKKQKNKVKRKPSQISQTKNVLFIVSSVAIYEAQSLSNQASLCWSTQKIHMINTWSSVVKSALGSLSPSQEIPNCMDCYSDILTNEKICQTIVNVNQQNSAEFHQDCFAMSVIRILDIKYYCIYLGKHLMRNKMRNKIFMHVKNVLHEIWICINFCVGTIVAAVVVLQFHTKHLLWICFFFSMNPKTESVIR